MSEQAEEYQEPDVDSVDQEEVVSDEDTGGPSEVEQKASQQGWAPKDQWRGNPDDWIDADEFLERGRNNNAILKERNDKLLGEVSSLREELRSSVKQFGESTRRAEERAYKKAMDDLRAQQEAAVESADTESWRRLESQKLSLQEDFKESQKQPEQPQQQASPDTDPAFVSWSDENRWYNNDIDMTDYANRTVGPIVSRRLNLQPGQLPPREFYDEVAKEVKRKFPDRFRNTNRDGAPAVQGGTQGGGRKPKGKGYADLPADAKSACDKFVKQGLYKSKEEYVKDYFGDE